MNDFTKEELIEIAEYCNWKSYDTAHSDFRRNLRVKIDSMIDNYACDHMPQIPYENAIGNVHVCIKCFKEYVYE